MSRESLVEEALVSPALRLIGGNGEWSQDGDNRDLSEADDDSEYEGDSGDLSHCAGGRASGQGVSMDYSSLWGDDRAPLRDVSSPLHRIALTLMIRSARDLVRYQRRLKHGGDMPIAVSSDARDARIWLTNPTHGLLSLQSCCEVLFAEEVDALQIGRRILDDPAPLAAVPEPSPPDFYLSLIKPPNKQSFGLSARQGDAIPVN